jgi:hypothetical protein
MLLSDLHQWEPYKEHGIVAGPERASYLVRITEMIPAMDQNAGIFQTKRYSTKYDDVEVSMNMRMLEVTDYSEACLTVRADIPDAETWSAYFLCVSTDGDVWFKFGELMPDGEWRTDQLSDYESATSIDDLGDWNNLKVVAYTDSFWFFVNDVLMGTAQHDGSEYGDVGMFVLADGGPATWEFTLLKIYQLAKQASATPQP